KLPAIRAHFGAVLAFEVAWALSAAAGPHFRRTCWLADRPPRTSHSIARPPVSTPPSYRARRAAGRAHRPRTGRQRSARRGASWYCRPTSRRATAAGLRRHRHTCSVAAPNPTVRALATALSVAPAPPVPPTTQESP